MSDSVSLKVDEKVVARCLEIEMKAAITRALSGQEAIIGEIARRLLMQKVNSEGKPDQYARDGSPSLVDYLANKAVTEIVRRETEAMIMERSEVIRESIRAQIQKGAGKLAKAMFDSLLESMTVKYNHTVKVEYGE